MIISEAEAKEHLRLDGTADNAWLTLTIPAVESAIIRWVGAESRLYEIDAQGDSEVIRCVELAALVELAYQYRFREGAENTKMIDYYRQGFVLSAGATALLQPLRVPTVA